MSRPVLESARSALVAFSLAGVATGAGGCGKKPTETPMPEPAPAVIAVEEMCRTLVTRAGDAAALAQVLNGGEPGAGGTRPVTPEGGLFVSGRLVPSGDAVRTLELDLAEPSATLAAELEAAWGAPGSPPMMPGAPMKRIWTRDVDPDAGYLCTVSIALGVGETWDSGAVRELMFRPDPRG